MKRIALVICTVICLSISTCACQRNSPTIELTTNSPTTELVTDAPTTEPTTTEPSVTEPPTTEPITAESSDPDALPEYVPGSLELEAQWSSEFPFERKCRLIYYRLPGHFAELLTSEQRDDFVAYLEVYNKEHGYGETQEEMTLVMMIKRYGIPKEDFDKAVAKYASIVGTVQHEFDEVPNSDILYTFDNEIINYYYRYE